MQSADPGLRLTPLTIRAAALRLLARAEHATARPWRWWTSCSFRRLSSDATGCDGDVLRGAIQRHDGQPDVVCSEADRAYIEEACNLAPELAKMVLRLTDMGMIPDLDYRPGMPSIEQVRAHERAGGRWQVMDAQGAEPEEAVTINLRVREERIQIRNGLSFWQALGECRWAGRSRYRPCTPDGTPVDWRTLDEAAKEIT